MSLPWFAFDADAFTGDTAHLTTEETGAYLLLMLAYYRSEKPLPARDRALAAVCKLPMDRWLEAKVTLSEFFIEQDGVWRHDRIELEIKERADKHATAVANAKSGAKKRWAGKARSVPRAKPEAKPMDATRIPNHNTTGIATAIAPAIAPANRSLCQNDAQEQEHINSLSARAREGDQDVQGKVKEEPFSDDEGIGTLIDPGFWPSPNRLATCKFDGADLETIKREVSGFIDNKLQSGSYSNDWDASWGIWWKRWQDHKAKEVARQEKKAARPKPPSVTTPAPTASTAPSAIDGPYIPTAVELDRTIPMWLTGVRWPRSFGPEPGQIGCRVPKSILEKHSIDPKTGMRVSKPEDAKV